MMPALRRRVLARRETADGGFRAIFITPLSEGRAGLGICIPVGIRGSGLGITEAAVIDGRAVRGRSAPGPQLSARLRCTMKIFGLNTVVGVFGQRTAQKGRSCRRLDSGLEERMLRGCRKPDTGLNTTALTTRAGTGRGGTVCVSTGRSVDFERRRCADHRFCMLAGA